ncbi:MAG: hypothetical protein AB1641_28505 [Thermodesulfobacteriota bacterium]
MKNHGLASFLAMMAVLAVLITANPASGAITPQELDSLKQAGLSEETALALAELHGESLGRREPVLSHAETEKLLQEKFSDEIIRLFIKLDRLTLDREQPPLTPAQVRELVKAGVSHQTVKLMLISEVALAAGVEPSPPSKNQEKKRKPPVGQEIRTDAEGRRSIVYYSGDTEGLSQETTKDEDGRRIIVYRSLAPDNPDEAGRQQEELRRAYELLKRIRIHIHR